MFSDRINQGGSFLGLSRGLQNGYRSQVQVT